VAGTASVGVVLDRPELRIGTKPILREAAQRSGVGGAVSGIERNNRDAVRHRYRLLYESGTVTHTIAAVSQTDLADASNRTTGFRIDWRILFALRCGWR